MFKSNCQECACPVIILQQHKPLRRVIKCIRCREKNLQSVTTYGKRPLELRLKKRENKRLWAQKNAELIKERATARRLADPEKYRAIRRETRRRCRERKELGLPLIKDQPS